MEMHQNLYDIKKLISDLPFAVCKQMQAEKMNDEGVVITKETPIRAADSNTLMVDQTQLLVRDPLANRPYTADPNVSAHHTNTCNDTETCKLLERIRVSTDQKNFMRLMFDERNNRPPIFHISEKDANGLPTIFSSAPFHTTSLDSGHHWLVLDKRSDLPIQYQTSVIKWLVHVGGAKVQHIAICK